MEDRVVSSKSEMSALIQAYMECMRYVLVHRGVKHKLTADYLLLEQVFNTTCHLLCQSLWDSTEPFTVQMLSYQGVSGKSHFIIRNNAKIYTRHPLKLRFFLGFLDFPVLFFSFSFSHLTTYIFNMLN